MKIMKYLKPGFYGKWSWVLPDQVITSGGSFLTTVILARSLGINDFGVFSTILLFLYLLLSISNAFIVSPFQVLQATHENLRAYVSSLFFLQIIVCVLLAFSGAFFFLLQVPMLEAIRPYLLYSLLLTAGFLMHDFLRRVLLATGKSRQAFLIDLLNMALQVACLLFFSDSVSLHRVLLIMTLTYIPALIAGIWFIQPARPSVSCLVQTIGDHVKHGKWLLFTAILQWWAGNLFVVASGIFLGVKALGALRLAQTLFGVLNVILQVFENHVLPEASRLYHESEEQLKHYLKTSTRRSTLLMLPVSVVLVVFAKEIFMLTGGSDYIDYAFALQGMALLYFLIFTGYASRLAIRVMMLNRVFFTGYVLSFLFSLIAARFFIQQWGLMGVIAGLITNQLLLQVYWQYVLMRKNFKLYLI